MIDRDLKKQIKFASLQSDIGQFLLVKNGFDKNLLSTVILIQDGAVYTKSDAALHVLKNLSFPWFLFYPLIFFPKIFRNFFYDWIAKKRYDWFGHRDVCRIPDADTLERFLDS